MVFLSNEVIIENIFRNILAQNFDQEGFITKYVADIEDRVAIFKAAESIGKLSQLLELTTTYPEIMPILTELDPEELEPANFNMDILSVIESVKSILTTSEVNSVWFNKAIIHSLSSGLFSEIIQATFKTINSLKTDFESLLEEVHLHRAEIISLMIDFSLIDLARSGQAISLPIPYFGGGGDGPGDNGGSGGGFTVGFAGDTQPEPTTPLILGAAPNITES